MGGCNSASTSLLGVIMGLVITVIIIMLVYIAYICTIHIGITNNDGIRYLLWIPILFGGCGYGISSDTRSLHSTVVSTHHSVSNYVKESK